MSNAASYDSSGQDSVYSRSVSPNSTYPLNSPSLFVRMTTVGSDGTSGKSVGSSGSVGVIGSVGSTGVGSGSGSVSVSLAGGFVYSSSVGIVVFVAVSSITGVV